MISLIVAYTKNGQVIGNNGKLPWNIPGELDRFKFLTTNNVVIMGRITYEEIGRPLPNRFNIVISSTKEYKEKNLITVTSLEKAINYAKTKNYKNIYIIGGKSVYEKALKYCETLYITEIEQDYSGNITFPDFDKSLYKKEQVLHVEKPVPYTYYTYTKIKQTDYLYE